MAQAEGRRFRRIEYEEQDRQMREIEDREDEEESLNTLSSTELVVSQWLGGYVSGGSDGICLRDYKRWLICNY